MSRYRYERSNLYGTGLSLPELITVGFAGLCILSIFFFLADSTIFSKSVQKEAHMLEKVYEASTLIPINNGTSTSGKFLDCFRGDKVTYDVMKSRVTGLVYQGNVVSCSRDI